MQPIEIKQARKDLGYTQQKLADLTGVNIRSIQFFEAGQLNPKKTWSILFKIIIEKGE